MSKNILSPAKIIAEYGAYYGLNKLNAQQLHDQIMTKSDIKVLFRTQTTELTRIDNVNKMMTSVLQPFYNRFSPNGILDFVPNPFNLDPVKINVEIEPDVLAATALDWLVQKGVARKDAPIVEVIAKYLIMKAKEDDELYAAFKGVKVVPNSTQIAAREALPPQNARNGIRKVIRDYNTAGKTNGIAMGAVPTDPEDFVDYIETLFYSIPEEKRGFIKWISVSDSMETRFRRGMRIKYNQNYEQAGSLAAIIDTGVQVRGFHAQRGSEMIWTAFPENCIGYVKKPSNQSVFDLDTHEIYQVQMATDWWEGYNFINPAWVWHNSQDLTDPAPTPDPEEED